MMENLLCNRLPVPLINIKDSDDCIIEGINTTISNTEIVNEWDVKNCKKIKSKLSVYQNEKVFEDVLKDYIRVVREQALNFKERIVLKQKILRHIKVFYMYYSVNDGMCLDMFNYLDYMEQILTILCNLELEVVRHIKRKEKEYCKKIKEVAQNLINILNIYMLNRERNILHVLLKLDSKRDTQSWKDVMHIIYRYFLITVPVKDRSDECFCRNYLLFQRWKSITDEKKHMGMDKIMYFRFSRSPDSIASSRTLGTVLLPSADSIVDVVDVLTDGRQTAVDAYFKYMEEKDREDDICLPQSIDLDSEEEDSLPTLQFTHGEKEKRCNGLIKSEKSAQESVHYVEIPASNGQMVCVIEDDSDVEEVSVHVTNKSRHKSSQKSASPRPVLSFLDSIFIPDDDSSSPVDALPSTSTNAAEETTIPSLAAENSSLLTTYLNHMRDQGSVIETHREPEGVEVDMESLSIANGAEVRMETESPNVQNTVASGASVLLDSVNDTNMEKESGQDISAQNVQSDNQVSLNKKLGVRNCGCPCKHLCNDGLKSSAVNNQVPESPSETMEIHERESVDFNLSEGMITPPSSDRTSDETSPESMETICPTQNSNLNDNTNVYSYIPSLMVSKTYIENSPYPYESDTETNGNNYCESRTQISDFLEPNNNQEQNLKDKDPDEDPGTDITSNLHQEEQITTAQESLDLDNSTLLSPTELEPISEIEVSEIMLPPLQACEEVDSNELEEVDSNELEDHDHDTELEHCSGLSDVQQEVHEEYEIVNSMEQVGAVLDNEAGKDDDGGTAGDNGAYSDLSTMQVAIAEPQPIDNQDGEAPGFVIPMDVILDNYQIPDNEISNEKSSKTDYRPFVTEGELVLNVAKSDVYNTFSMFKKIPGTDTVDAPSVQSEPLNNSNKKVPTNETVKRATEEVKSIDNHKIQASINMTDLVTKPVKTPKKLNGDNTKTVKNNTRLLFEQKRDKIIFTSNERVSAPLSLFAQFEQSQSDLVEMSLSGPIEPINGTASINSDDSNFSDSFYLFESSKSSVKENKPNQLATLEDSPVSPPYEDIHAQEYQNHMLAVNLDGLVVGKSKQSAERDLAIDENRDNKLHERRESRLNNVQQSRVGSSDKSIIGTRGISKRKRNEEGAVPAKKPRVNFGSTEIRIIPRDNSRFVSDEVIEDARESMEEYKISVNDHKLLFLQPQVPVKMETPGQLNKNYNQYLLQSAIRSLLSAKKFNISNLETTCIVKRVDYKKVTDESGSSLNTSGKSLDNTLNANYSPLIGASLLNAISKRIETSSFPPPSGYVPTLNVIDPGIHSRPESSIIEDSEDSAKSITDSHVTARNRRAAVSRPKNQILAKTPPEPPASVRRLQRRPRGRPKKGDKRKKMDTAGILYTDGPFRLE